MTNRRLLLLLGLLAAVVKYAWAVTCDRPSDLIWVLDGSDSVGNSAFTTKVRVFVADVASNFNLNQNGLLMGVLQFAGSTLTYDTMAVQYGIPLSLNLNTSQFVSKARALTYLSKSGTSTWVGINAGVDMARTQGRNSLLSSDIIIVITDGKSGDTTKTVAAADKARGNGFNVACVTIGTGYRLTEVQGISGYDPAMLFQAESFSTLGGVFVDQISSLICDAPVRRQDLSPATVPVPCSMDSIPLQYLSTLGSSFPVTLTATETSSTISSIRMCATWSDRMPSWSTMSDIATPIACKQAAGTVSFTSFPPASPHTMQLYVGVFPIYSSTATQTCSNNIAVTASTCYAREVPAGVDFATGQTLLGSITNNGNISAPLCSNCKDGYALYQSLVAGPLCVPDTGCPSTTTVQETSLAIAGTTACTSCMTMCTPLPSKTPTATRSRSWSSTATDTPPPSPSSSITGSNTKTATVSASFSGTATVSRTLSGTATSSISYSQTGSISSSYSNTATVSKSLSGTATVSKSLSSTSTASISLSATSTRTRTKSPVSATSTVTPGLSPSESESVSPSPTESESVSESPSVSPSRSEEATTSPTRSPTRSPTPSRSPSSSTSPSWSPSRSTTPSQSEEATASPSVSVSPSESVSPSVSPSVSTAPIVAAVPPGRAGDFGAALGGDGFDASGNASLLGAGAGGAGTSATGLDNPATRAAVFGGIGAFIFLLLLACCYIFMCCYLPRKRRREKEARKRLQQRKSFAVAAGSLSKKGKSHGLNPMFAVDPASLKNRRASKAATTAGPRLSMALQAIQKPQVVVATRRASQYGNKRQSQYAFRPSMAFDQQAALVEEAEEQAPEATYEQQEEEQQAQVEQEDDGLTGNPLFQHSPSYHRPSVVASQLSMYASPRSPRKSTAAPRGNPLFGQAFAEDEEEQTEAPQPAAGDEAVGIDDDNADDDDAVDDEDNLASASKRGGAKAAPSWKRSYDSKEKHSTNNALSPPQEKRKLIIAQGAIVQEQVTQQRVVLRRVSKVKGDKELTALRKQAAARPSVAAVFSPQFAGGGGGGEVAASRAGVKSAREALGIYSPYTFSANVARQKVRVPTKRVIDLNSAKVVTPSMGASSPSYPEEGEGEGEGGGEGEGDDTAAAFGVAEDDPGESNDYNYDDDGGRGPY